MTERPTTILIVDDEPHVVHVVRLKLERAGYTVLVANNGKGAYGLACRHMPDLVVTDFQMPGGTGLELAKELRENPETAEIPLVMLTARGHRAPLAELAETNVRCLLAKPFSPRNLLSKVEELLGTSVDANRSGGASAA